MNIHKSLIIEQVAQYASDISHRQKNQLLNILSDPDNILSGEFFELYNKKAVAELLDDGEDINLYDEKLRQFFSRIITYNKDCVQEIASGELSCAFANSIDLIEWLEDNCEDWQYGYNKNLSIVLQSNQDITEQLFEINNDDVRILINDRVIYKGFKKFFLECAHIFTKGAFDNSSLIMLIKSDILDTKINETYQNLIQFVEYKKRTPKDHNKYINAYNDDLAKKIVDKDIEVIQELIEYHQYEIFDTKLSEVDSQITGLLSNSNSKYVSLLKKIIGLNNQADENDIHLQTLFPLSTKLFKGMPVKEILLRYYKNNYAEDRAKISSALLDLQQQEILLRARMRGYIKL